MFKVIYSKSSETYQLEILKNLLEYAGRGMKNEYTGHNIGLDIGLKLRKYEKYIKFVTCL